MSGIQLLLLISNFADYHDSQAVWERAWVFDTSNMHSASAAYLQLPFQAPFTSTVSESMRLAHK